MEGSGYLPLGADQAYECTRDDGWLIGTSEVPVTALHSGEILEEAKLPIRYAAYSACFRREAGTHGKDTRGLYRVHQFMKVEQVVICGYASEFCVDTTTRRAAGLGFPVVLVADAHTTHDKPHATRGSGRR